MNFGLRLRHAHEHKLNHELKAQLKLMLGLRQKLKSPFEGEATKGLEGMLEADRILKENNASGILIGGLSEAVWNARTTIEDLRDHKDVDVLVVGDFHLSKFEGGIDWWTKNEIEITLTDDYSGITNMNQIYYYNVNDVVLSYSLLPQDTSYYPRGLIIPSSEWVISMRFSEAMANFEEKYQQDSSALEQDFTKKMRRSVRESLPRYLQKAFAGQIFSSKYGSEFGYESRPLLEELSLKKLRAIDSAKKKYLE